ncbi:NADH-quinone oxidoreductase subunit C [Micromonospora tulbaghiae]|uniref:NADH-quinone oxidoreductase n=1 Tax=Micromonospora tulbaghiae TaxID=479978 RepID=A0AAW4JQX0_9ACTN|nr:NADH-quinone oxidoreductase subunit C [Micromonospora sp. AMSO1212t]MBO4143530.1 NADH-quinone oxidoreductase subunit C [Micromonospora tulbaghiae]SCF08075.1 NADH-quinone oxidoreductase subunit C [Micromonospora tulbaghiae]
MTPEEVGRRVVALLAPVEAAASVSGGQGYARATVDVPPASWADAVRAARDDAELGLDFLDWLSAVDELADGFDVVLHLWSVRHRHGLLLRTRVPRDTPVVASVVDLFPGAAWHERETHEMFGIDFAGHGELRPLLLPPEFEGHPLRKEFVLASRVAKPWPGAKEPGESEAGGGRRPVRPPGVPAPGEWGTTPTPAGAAGAGEGPRGGTPARPARERPARPAPGERPARPASAERPARPPAGEASDRPAAGDGPARSVPGERPARPAAPGEGAARATAGEGAARPAAGEAPESPASGEAGPGSGVAPATDQPSPLGRPLPGERPTGPPRQEPEPDAAGES